MSPLLRSLRTIRHVFSHKKRRLRKRRFIQAAHPSANPEPHPNLRLTYERVRELEASLTRSANDITNKVAALVAVFGFAIVGLLSAIDKYAWGFVQHNRLDSWINGGGLGITLLLGLRAAVNLVKAYRWTEVVYPWRAEIKDPARTVTQDADYTLIKLIGDLNQANNFNARIVRLQTRHLSRAAWYLVAISLLITLQIGYNSARKSLKEVPSTQPPVQKAGLPCQSFPATEPSVRQTPQILPPRMSRKATMSVSLLTGKMGRKPSSSMPTGSESVPGAIKPQRSGR